MSTDPSFNLNKNSLAESAISPKKVSFAGITLRSINSLKAACLSPIDHCNLAL